MNNNYWLSSVKMGGYKSIKLVEIDFQPGLNIIIGKNGTGKTNFLDFLDNSLKMKFEGVRDFIFDANLSYENQEIKINVKGESVKKTAQADSFFSKGNNIKSRVKAEVELNGEKKTFSRLIMENSEDVYLGEISEYLYEKNISLSNLIKVDYSIPSNVTFFHNIGSLDIEALKTASYEKGSLVDIVIEFAEKHKKEGKYNLLEMRLDFVNYLDVIYNWGLLSNLRKWLKIFTPVKDIRFNQSIFLLDKNNSIEITNLIYEFNINNDWYFFNDLSDGTKRIVWIIYQFITNKAQIFLLEEPELGIHPHQLDLLMKFLKEQSQEKQIILTTHAPQCLDILTPEELNHIIICDIENKSTQLFHLNEQKMKKARAYMEESDTLSSYWRFSDLENR